MKPPVALALLLLSASPLAAQSPALPGVSDEETTISSGGIRQFERGHGDVIFVRDQSDRWYRVQLNKGCLEMMSPSDGLSFDTSTPGGRIDRFTHVVQPRLGVTCAINSIRRSEAPPQVDSKSRVTLD